VVGYRADERGRGVYFLARSHACPRLGLDLSQLESSIDISEPADQGPDLGNLRQAATSLAACWFSLCGFNTAIPIEPAVYDLLVSRPDGIKRVKSRRRRTKVRTAG
jgi:hypothetical protein